MHGTIMIFFAVTPILIGAFGNFCIPLEIGARDMSFPTLNMLSFWTQVVASLARRRRLAVRPWARAKAGWTAYPPLSTQLGTPGAGQTLWTISLIVAGASTTMGAVNYITTVLRERAPGMTHVPHAADHLGPVAHVDPQRALRARPRRRPCCCSSAIASSARTSSSPAR